ncbi:hypothetical protein EXU48_05650 [Occultella glacieicola]|uniref:Uncharacterized protein n=1 Tax=Occultella glacieicola TaxID=2518684 RepID=A0ABY2E576_9MICO|nr:hypothetical protein [Occultella glacieicola]TDE95752.1 hypothetical protein EXU48_05650 [Occultella glacieicola]
MTPQTRPNRTTERNAALACLRSALVPGAIAAVCWLGPAWPPLQQVVADAGLVEFADLQRVATIAAVVALGLVVFHLARSGRHLLRWVRAVRWEQQFDDPERAHLVPPLASHTRSLTSWSSWLRWVLLGGLVLAGALVYAGLAALGLVPRPTDEMIDGWATPVLGVLALVAVGWVARVRLAGRRLRARTVERLSGDTAAPRATAEVAADRAERIPTLEVSFGAWGPDPGRLTRRAGRRVSGPLQILYLRLFDNVDGTAAFLGSPWRTVGLVHLLRGSDQVEADELRAARARGSVATLFIRSPEQLSAVLAELPSQRHDPATPHGVLARIRWLRDPERGRYPVRGLLCHGSFWRRAVDLMLDRMDLVVLDLSGYRPENIGTRFELQRVVDGFPVDRVLFLAEPHSDQPFLTAQLRAAWSAMAAGSPNEGTGTRRARVAWDTPPTGFRYAGAAAGSAGASTRTRPG